MTLEARAGEMMRARAAEALGPAWEPVPEWEDGAQAPPEAGPGLGLGLGLPFEGVLGPQERRLAASIVAGLEPSDPQEEMHSWKLAVTHLLAAERIGKARQPDLPDHPQQIELGLALRLMSLNQRESTALDRHRDMKARAEERAEKRAEKRAAARRTAGWPQRVTQSG